MSPLRFSRTLVVSVGVCNERPRPDYPYLFGLRGHPTRAELILSSQKEGGFNQKLKVLPLTWFYGGKEPADNPVLARIYDHGNPNA